jgi:hypothetical protein
VSFSSPTTTARESDFVSSLVRGTTDLDPALNVVIVWRKDSINLKYEWLEREWQEETANASSDDLHRTLQVNFDFCGKKTEKNLSQDWAKLSKYQKGFIFVISFLLFYLLRI